TWHRCGRAVPRWRVKAPQRTLHLQEFFASATYFGSCQCPLRALRCRHTSFSKGGKRVTRLTVNFNHLERRTSAVGPEDQCSPTGAIRTWGGSRWGSPAPKHWLKMNRKLLTGLSDWSGASVTWSGKRTAMRMVVTSTTLPC